MLKSILFILLSFLFHHEIFAQFPIKINKDIINKNIELKTDTIKFGKLRVVTTLIHSKNPSESNFSCKAWLSIYKDKKIISQKTYNIEPLGGCSGLYAAPTNISQKFLIVSKFGDYHGETILINREGKIINLHGGSFSISKDQKYLFSIVDSDISEIMIFDLIHEKIIANKEVIGEKRFDSFHFLNGNYYVSYEKENGSKKQTINLINLKENRLQAVEIPNEFFKKSKKLFEYNAVQKLAKCNCGT